MDILTTRNADTGEAFALSTDPETNELVLWYLDADGTEHEARIDPANF